MRISLALWMLALTAVSFAATPKLKIELAHKGPCEQETELQLGRLSSEYDLSKFTITREIRIERCAMAHSKPVLTMNCRFLQNDDLALSQYVHEQGHWVLGRREGEMRSLYEDLTRSFPAIPTEYPKGGFGERDSYFHLAVILLEWQGMEELVGEKRALAEMKWKQGDHYTELYRTVMENREAMEKILRNHDIHW
ncbi:hypothetical protein Acid345_2906 [Candidatus Koribacter versatilis Ellin345]|uniref:IrrE N-terminal-like domain-containing protein n=1 Tax=Koribacter versatilis (strain Ellin345) TaxID=204669 RepID=Q1IMJ3_KORVE|nr:hypothetical protein [Candidatus Koribacter versatilis]ABF41907.1 hypothetical protein Acid345_2906 [Candidatus Koribacter versatilis Ellin345]